jgi:Mg-chelatase subunit ChlD
MTRSSALRLGAARHRFLLAIVVCLGVIFYSRRNARRAGSDGSAMPADTGKYVPAGDEGLGASIALLMDVSGSMSSAAKGDTRPKYIVAREALRAMLEATDSFVVRQPGFPINVGLYAFNGDVTPLVPVRPYNREELRKALAASPEPSGSTAIGDAMDLARRDLYNAGTIRKYILVVTDGENTTGRSPRDVAREIARRSEGAVRQYFVAFDVEASRFAFLKEVNGEVLGAANGIALKAGLDSIYRGKILAESMNAGETSPPLIKKNQ